jgi:hypothetical protein
MNKKEDTVKVNAPNAMVLDIKGHGTQCPIDKIILNWRYN